jgi:hypothetical protein
VLPKDTAARIQLGYVHSIISSRNRLIVNADEVVGEAFDDGGSFRSLCRRIVDRNKDSLLGLDKQAAVTLCARDDQYAKKPKHGI